LKSVTLGSFQNKTRCTSFSLAHDCARSQLLCAQSCLCDWSSGVGARACSCSINFLVCVSSCCPCSLAWALECWCPQASPTLDRIGCMGRVPKFPKFPKLPFYAPIFRIDSFSSKTCKNTKIEQNSKIKKLTSVN
jgi:hypothetical protein